MKKQKNPNVGQTITLKKVNSAYEKLEELSIRAQMEIEEAEERKLDEELWNS